MSRIVLLAVTMAAMVAGANAAPAPAPADLTTLSVEDAKALAADPAGKVSLPRITTLTADAARELVKQPNGGWLELNGLTALPDDVAAALGEHQGPLFLNGLKTLSAPAAGALANHRGYLSLNGVTTLPDEAAKVLLTHNRLDASGELLSLNGLQTLSAEAAGAIAARRSRASFLGLTTLTPEVAQILAKARAWDGVLPSFTSVTPELAAALAQREQGVTMPGLTSLPPEIATAFKGKLRGVGPYLTAIPLESLKALAAANALPTSLDRLTTLSAEEATILATAGSTRAVLTFGGLKSLSPEAAKALMKREGWVYLNGLATIPDDVVQALVEEKNYHFEPRVFLDGLTTVTDESAALLAAWPKWGGRLPALTAISAKAAEAIGSSRNWDGRLPALKTLSPEAAQGLVAFRGDLLLDGLADLSPETAEALASHRGGVLSLDGLKTLSDKVAAALAARPGRLSLDGLTSIAPATAAALGGHAGDWLFLDGLPTLADEAAKSLAAHKGVVSLMGLKTLSPAAVQSLHATGRILLPATFPRPAPAAVAAADAKFVRGFLDTTCMGCHDADSPEGDFAMDKLKAGEIGGRVAFASILERLQAGDMPPPDEPRPDPASVAKVTAWIRALLDSPPPEPVPPYAVKEKPGDGNRLPHAILFGGPRGPSVPPPPRLWRLSPSAYDQWVGSLPGGGTQQPFGLVLERGFKDFAAIYTADEATASLLLTNAEQIVDSQTSGHQLVNVVEKPDLAKQRLWPDDGRLKAASPEEQKALESGIRVAQGNGVFAPLLHPQVRATRQELEAAIRQQFLKALARQPEPRELESLFTLYEENCRDGDMRVAGRSVLMAPLMVPDAVLRFEVGGGPEVRPGVRMLAPREIAMALGYALSQTRVPDLFTLADTGGLADRDAIRGHVRGLLDDSRRPKSRVFGFFREYLSYHLAEEVFKDPLPDHEVRRGMHYSPASYVNATDATLLRILARDRDVLRELLTTPTISDNVGEYVNGVFHDRGQTPVFRPLPPSVGERPTGGRIGIPMHSSWLVSWSTNFHTDPVRRGRWVREQLLGGRVPDLPINAAAMIPDDPHRTLRERQSVTREAQCWKCHYRMDDLGMPFEFLDHYGYERPGERVLDLEAMKKSGNNNPLHRMVPFDTTGEIAFSGDPAIDGPVRDAAEMLRRLAGSDRVRQVFIRHVFRYFLGRNETPGDAVTLQEADRVYVESGGSFKALLASLLSSESFLYRTVPAAAPTATKQAAR
jgi:hypothetical protein